jgi:DNA-binding transcriptional LysR family regulator
MTRPGHIDPDLLRSFLHVAETASFTRTAERVGRSQSTVSMQVQRLESLLGATLLARGRGGSVRLTADGARLVARAREMLALNDAIWAEFHRAGPADPAPPIDDTLPVTAQREAFTAQIMATLLTHEKFTEAYALIMRHVENRETLEPARVDPREDELYMALLSMLEYIAINFLSGAIDRAVILRQRRSGLLVVWRFLADYIAYKRQVWNRPNAYRSFETLVTEHILPESAAA